MRLSWLSDVHDRMTGRDSTAPLNVHVAGTSDGLHSLLDALYGHEGRQAWRDSVKGQISRDVERGHAPPFPSRRDYLNQFVSIGDSTSLAMRGGSTDGPSSTMMIDALMAERGCERDALASDYRLARARGDLEAALQIAFQIEARRRDRGYPSPSTPDRS